MASQVPYKCSLKTQVSVRALSETAAKIDLSHTASRAGAVVRKEPQDHRHGGPEVMPSSTPTISESVQERLAVDPFCPENTTCHNDLSLDQLLELEREVDSQV